MTKLEIIDETVKYYSEEPSRRALNETYKCVYMTDDGRKCAVGRCIDDKTHFDFSSMDNIQSLAAGADKNKIFYGSVDFEGNIDNFFKNPYKGHNLRFWRDLQIFHDSSEHFDIINSSLSSIGKIYVDELITKYKN